VTLLADHSSRTDTQPCHYAKPWEVVRFSESSARLFDQFPHLLQDDFRAPIMPQTRAPPHCTSKMHFGASSCPGRTFAGANAGNRRSNAVLIVGFGRSSEVGLGRKIIRFQVWLFTRAVVKCWPHGDPSWNADDRSRSCVEPALGQCVR
jgi:hypothetical protein